MPYISVNHSQKIDFSAHSFSEPFTENRILLLHFQSIHSLKIDSSAQSFSEPFTENSFYGAVPSSVPPSFSMTHKHLPVLHAELALDQHFPSSLKYYNRGSIWRRLIFSSFSFAKHKHMLPVYTI